MSRFLSVRRLDYVFAACAGIMAVGTMFVVIRYVVLAIVGG